MIASTTALLLALASLSWATPMHTTAITTTHSPALERRAPETFRGRRRSRSAHGRWNRSRSGDRHWLQRRDVTKPQLERRWNTSRRGWARGGRGWSSSRNGRRYSTSRRGRAFHGHFLQRRAISAEPKATLERRGWRSRRHSSSRHGRRFSTSRHGRRYSTSRRGRVIVPVHTVHGGHFLKRRAVSAEPKPALERRGYYSSRRGFSTSHRGRVFVPVRTHVPVHVHHRHVLYRRANLVGPSNVWGHAAGDADDQWHDAMSRAGKLPGHFPNDLDDQIKHGQTTWNSPSGLWGQRRTWSGTSWNNGANWNNGWNRGGDYDSDHHDSWDEKADEDNAARTVEADEEAPKPKPVAEKKKVPRKTLQRRWNGDSFRGRGSFNHGFNNVHGGAIHRGNRLDSDRNGRFWSEAGAERDDKVEEEDTKKKVSSQDVKTAKLSGASTAVGGGAKPKLQRRGYHSDGYGSDSGSGSDSGYGHSHHGRPHYRRPRRVIYRPVPVHHHHVSAY